MSYQGSPTNWKIDYTLSGLLSWRAWVIESKDLDFNNNCISHVILKKTLKIFQNLGFLIIPEQ